MNEYIFKLQHVSATKAIIRYQ